jgi:hypothetical protein
MPSFIWCEHCGQKIEVKDFVVINACPVCDRSVEGDFLASMNPDLTHRIVYFAGAGFSVVLGLVMVLYSLLHREWLDVVTWVGLTAVGIIFCLAGFIAFVRKKERG